MKRVFIPLCLFTLGFGLVFCPSALGQESGDKSAAPESAVQSDQRSHVPVFGNADEFVLMPSLEYYQPELGFNRTNRDIDLQVGTIGVGAHFRHGWEFEFGGSVLRAHGYRTLPSGAPSPQIPSNAQGLGIGPMAR
jgi:hypothetical protein